MSFGKLSWNTYLVKFKHVIEHAADCREHNNETEALHKLYKRVMLISLNKTHQIAKGYIARPNSKVCTTDYENLNVNDKLVTEKSSINRYNQVLREIFHCINISLLLLLLFLLSAIELTYQDKSCFLIFLF